MQDKLIIIVMFWMIQFTLEAQELNDMGTRSVVELECVQMKDGTFVSAVMERVQNIDRVLIYRSENLGRNWTLIDSIQSTHDSLGDAYDPVLTVTEDDKLFLVVMRRNIHGTGILTMDLEIYESVDLGLNWSLVGNPHKNDGIADYPQIINDYNGNLYLVYSHFQMVDNDLEGHVNYRESTDNGRSWSIAETFEIPSKSPCGPDLSWTSNGVLRMVFGDNKQENIYITESLDKGNSWAVLDTISNNEENNICKPLGDSGTSYFGVLSHRPHMDHTKINYHFYDHSTLRWNSSVIANGSYAEMYREDNGEIHMIYNENNEGMFQLNYTFSLDSGNSFSVPTVLYQATYSSSRLGEYQSLIKGVDGYFYVVFCDWSDDSDVKVLRFAPFISTGVEEVLEKELRLYPNPTDSYLTLDFKNSKTVKKVSVFDLRGNLKEVKITQENQLTLDLFGLQKGSYLVRIQEGSLIKVEKVVKL